MSQVSAAKPIATLEQTTGQPGPTRLGYIDGLRAVACLAVFAHHCWMFAGKPEWRVPLLRGHSLNVLRVCQFGDTGVHLFLLLSGYCLFRSLARPGGWARFDAVTFARQRAWRILPAYYAACALFLVLPVLLAPVHGFHFAPAPGALSLLLHAVLLHGFYAPALYDMNGAFWSLSLEWQFYFTFPLLAWAFHRRGPWLTLLAVGTVNLLYRCAVARWLLSADTTADWTWCSLFPGRWLEFALGMLAAWQSARQESRGWPAAKVAGAVVAALTCVALGSQVAAFSPFSDLLWGVAYFCLLRLALLPTSALQRRLSARPLVWIGTISYSIYLLHMPLLGLVADLMPHAGAGHVKLVVLAGIGLLIVLPLAALSYRFLERPYIHRGRAASRGSEPAMAGARPV